MKNPRTNRQTIPAICPGTFSQWHCDCGKTTNKQTRKKEN